MDDARPFRERLAAVIAKTEADAAADPDRFEGAEWWQLSTEEEAVFAIDRDRHPAMCDTWTAYERFKNIIHEDFFGPPEVIEQARRDHPEWCGTQVTAEEFAAFAKAMSGLSFREAFAMYAKHEFWCIRQGIMRYADERG